MCEHKIADYWTYDTPGHKTSINYIVCLYEVRLPELCAVRCCLFLLDGLFCFWKSMVMDVGVVFCIVRNCG